MTLVASVRSFSSLQDRCRAVIARHLVNPSPSIVASLPLPGPLRRYVAAVVPEGCGGGGGGAVPRAMAQQQYPPGRRRVSVALKFWPPSDVNYWPRSGWVDDCLRT